MAEAVMQACAWTALTDPKRAPHCTQVNGRSGTSGRGTSVDVPGFKIRMAQVLLFTTHNGYNFVIVIGAMEAKDAEFLTTLVEHIKYTAP
jgi:hypothetical protein